MVGLGFLVDCFLYKTNPNPRKTIFCCGEKWPKMPLLIPVTMGTRCFHKKLEFQRYPPKDFCTARYERKSSKKKFRTFQKPRKKQFLGRSWAKIGLRKTQPNVCSKRRDSESWTDIERQNRGPTPQRVGWTVTGPSLAGRLHSLGFC